MIIGPAGLPCRLAIRHSKTRTQIDFVHCRYTSIGATAIAIAIAITAIAVAIAIRYFHYNRRCDSAAIAIACRCTSHIDFAIAIRPPSI
ncbi:hypothetical protein IV203_020659 [Nitzschia inconspicua]|uniref:Uncharacterized protein n=1 Tax=Nitzschia inconspicua TaxID=303405 RepID=A0A9K3PDA4_9STRA|nr:hypothetical protein IV203_034412 [Nitzschia inconspicua]KAG7342715.1 hypothetical protein IV203_020659 [Nitzschia inconspicua]